MATKKCPECGKKVSLNETDCPHCGAFVYRYKDVYANKEDCKHITSQPVNSCSHETYTKERSYTENNDFRQITITKKPVSYSKKVSYTKQAVDQQKALAILSLVFSFFGLFGNVIFSFVSASFIKMIKRNNPENEEILKIIKPAKVFNTIAFIIFGIIIFTSIFGGLLVEFIPVEIIEGFLESFLS